MGSGSPFTQVMLVRELQAALQESGIPPSQYKGHTFRIGAAITALKCGPEDSLIQTLGKWKSAAYPTYIWIPPQELAATSILVFLCLLHNQPHVGQHVTHPCWVRLSHYRNICCKGAHLALGQWTTHFGEQGAGY